VTNKKRPKEEEFSKYFANVGNYNICSEGKAHNQRIEIFCTLNVKL